VLRFTEVGLVGSDAAELALHDGRIFVSTWPNPPATTAGLHMSPSIPAGGFTAPAQPWGKVWDVTDYEPDPVTARTYGGGALQSYGGKLYWGTMHVPFVSTLAHYRAYEASYGPGGPSPRQVLAMMLGTYRPITVFRGDEFGTAEQAVELLYGLPRLPVFAGGAWQLADNAMGARPQQGLAGFGNFFNNYTWTMAVAADGADGDLFVGTMDWSYLLSRMLPTLVETITGEPAPPIDDLRLPTAFFGADLWRFDTPHARALPESISGVGNYGNYGIRTMIADDDVLYLGSANPMNLLTDLDDDKPEGGWELLRLKR
jgi:hypothetical protein